MVKILIKIYDFLCDLIFLYLYPIHRTIFSSLTYQKPTYAKSKKNIHKYQIKQFYLTNQISPLKSIFFIQNITDP